MVTPPDLKEKIGAGQFADVWKATDHLDREVAVKIIRPASVGVSDALEHAKALARAKHPNVVEVHYISRVTAPGESTELDCVVMELLKGGTVEDHINSGTIARASAARIIASVIEGVTHMHSAGIVHDDIHEANVMVHGEVVKIIDLLYRDNLALLSTASEETRVRNDLTGLRSLIELVLARSEYGEAIAKRFVANVAIPPTLESVANTASDILGDGSEFEEEGRLDWLVTTDDEYIDSTIFFHHERFTQTFPGLRGIREFDDPKEATRRLLRLLKKPLGFRTNGGKGLQHPIWRWERGNRDIRSCVQMNESQLLIGNDELAIRRIAAFNAGAYHQSFVYVECDAMEPVGLYQHDKEFIRRMCEHGGFAYEEYASFDGIAITREEYDDGATEIDGEIVDTTGKAELRVRYLSPYNFLIAPQRSPVNNDAFDQELGAMLNSVIAGTIGFEELNASVLSLPKKEWDRF